MEARSTNLQTKAPHYGLEDIWQDVDRLPGLSAGGVLVQHLKTAVSSIIASPLTFVVTTLTVSLTLFLLSALILLRSNVEHFFGAPGKNIPMRIYITDGIAKEDIQKFHKELEALAGISSVLMTSKEEALREFEEQLGEQKAVLEGLKERNPLPMSFTLIVRSGQDATQVYEDIFAKYSGHEAVDYIEYRQGLILKLRRVLLVVQRFGALAIGLMILLAAGIITGAIRLAVYARRAEIAIMQLVGATESYVRMPFLIEGFFQGLIGSSVALLCLYGLFSSATGFLARTQVLDFLYVEPVFLGFSGIAVVLVLGVLTGLLGSFFAVRHFEEQL